MWELSLKLFGYWVIALVLALVFFYPMLVIGKRADTKPGVAPDQTGQFKKDVA